MGKRIREYISRIKNAKKLEDLAEILSALHVEPEVVVEALDRLLDLANLPTFGGEEPKITTFDVWSWDEGRVLVGADWDELEIVERGDWEAKVRRRRGEDVYWYAVQDGEGDTDWGTGAYDWEGAVALANRLACDRIAKILTGNCPICVEEFWRGRDFA